MKKENVPAYELVSCQDIPDIHSKGSLWRHKKSGARVMVLENDDEKEHHIHTLLHGGRTVGNGNTEPTRQQKSRMPSSA